MANGTGGEWGNRLRVAVWVLAVGLFLLPLVAMQFTAEVKWAAAFLRLATLAGERADD